MLTLYLCMVQRLIGLVIYRKAPTCFQFITFRLASTCFVSTCFVRASDCHHYWHLCPVLGFCANHEDCILLLQSTVQSSLEFPSLSGLPSSTMDCSPAEDHFLEIHHWILLSREIRLPTCGPRHHLLPLLIDEPLLGKYFLVEDQALTTKFRHGSKLLFTIWVDFKSLILLALERLTIGRLTIGRLTTANDSP